MNTKTVKFGRVHHKIVNSSNANIAPHFCLGTGVLKHSAGHSASAVIKDSAGGVDTLVCTFLGFFGLFFIVCDKLLQHKGKTKQKNKNQKIFLIDSQSY